jgi:putative protease
MTASSPLAVELLGELGLARVVVPRELSMDEIRAFAAATSVPLEVFIHGALCVAWSGQCLSSEAWGGRSANRGQCAQACRLPYQLVVDGDTRDLGDVAYLLSPKDLVGLDAVGALAEIGVAGLKIEGRLKGPAYVATAVAQYRDAVDAASSMRSSDESRFRGSLEIPRDEASLHVAYSRGVSRGFLFGTDHQTLVEGRFPRHRGLPLGRVVAVSGDTVIVVRDPAQRPNTGGRGMDGRASDGHDSDGRDSDGRVPDIVPRAGMGVVFERGRPEEAEQGGPIFAVDDLRDIGDGGDGRRGDRARRFRLRFGNPGPDLSRVSVGDFVWASSDPKLSRAGERSAEAGREPLQRIPVDLEVRGEVGSPLTVTATARSRRRDFVARAFSKASLAPARGTGLSAELVRDKLGALGGTPFHLAAVDATALASGLHLPVSELKELRRELVAALDAQVVDVRRDVAASSTIAEVRAALVDHHRSDEPPLLVPLCRNDAQLDAVLDAGAREVELDWMELVGLGRAVERARRRGARVGVATVRVQKPGEERIDAHLARLEPDFVLVRSWGSLAYFAGLATPPALHGDFSLNVTNSITAAWVLARGLATITAAHDLDRDQLLALLDAAPRGRVGVAIHHHLPTFHTEHCVYAHLLSTGRDYRTCGRPCERHAVSLRDRVGLVHPVIVDVGCRNTVFNAQAQSAASLVPTLRACGVTRFRVELVRETAAETSELYDAYRRLVAGELAPAEAVRRAAAHEQFGVTRGTMRTLTVLG